MSGTPIVGGTSGTANLVNGRFMGMFAGNQNGNENSVQNIMPTAGTIKNLWAFIEAAPGVGSSWTFTIRKNGVDTAVACTVTGTGAANQKCSDTTHSVVFAAGDLISVRESSTGAPATGAGQWTAVFAP